MSKYIKFEGVIAPNSGSGPLLNITNADGTNATVPPLADPTRTFSAGYYYQIPDGATVNGGHQTHSGTDFQPVVFVEVDAADVPYPLNTGEPS